VAGERFAQRRPGRAQLGRGGIHAAEPLGQGEGTLGLGPVGQESAGLPAQRDIDQGSACAQEQQMARRSLGTYFGVSPYRYDQPVTKDELLAYCLSKPGAWQDEPWEGDTVVKVGPKIFAFLGSGDGAATHGSVGVKCAANRDAADEWLKLYPDDASVMPYIGRSGWNTLRFGGAIPDDEVLDAVEESYRMIVAKLPKKDRPA
jgi:predicted DNA-binding protein (MmcQ/YjbR family)